MRRIHPLPTILTLGNFGSGFLAIVLAARSLAPQKDAAILPLTGQQTDLIYLACACIFLAMKPGLQQIECIHSCKCKH